MSGGGAYWRDEYELLCERCGYSIEGLARESACPECGRPVAASLPEARVGSAWQRGPSFGAWLATMRALALHPARTVRTLRIERERSGRFAGVNIKWGALLVALVATASLGAGWTTRSMPGLEGLAVTGPIGRGELAKLGLLYLGVWCLVAALLWGLSVVEYLGIRTFGRAHGKRITPTVAGAIVCHATAGWFGAALLVSLGHLLGAGMLRWALHHNVGLLRGPMMLSPGWLPLVGGLAGLLWFEIIVYSGVLTCKFANRERPALEPAADAASTGWAHRLPD